MNKQKHEPRNASDILHCQLARFECASIHVLLCTLGIFETLKLGNRDETSRQLATNLYKRVVSFRLLNVNPHNWSVLGKTG